MIEKQEITQKDWLDEKGKLNARMLYSGVLSGAFSLLSFALSVCGGPRFWEPEFTAFYLAKIGACGTTAALIIANMFYVIRLNRLFDKGIKKSC